MSRTAQWARVLDAADYELRHHNVIEANRHLRAMTPARRAELEAEWDVPVSDGRRTGPEAF